MSFFFSFKCVWPQHPLLSLCPRFSGSWWGICGESAEAKGNCGSTMCSQTRLESGSTHRPLRWSCEMDYYSKTLVFFLDLYLDRSVGDTELGGLCTCMFCGPKGILLWPLTGCKSRFNWSVHDILGRPHFLFRGLLKVKGIIPVTCCYH